MEQHLNLSKIIAECDEKIKWIQNSIVDRSLSDKKFGENAIKSIQIEKLMYVSLTKVGNNALFPKLLAKYDELVMESYQIVDDRVQEGNSEEGYYLRLCEMSLKKREHLKQVCDCGMHR